MFEIVTHACYIHSLLYTVCSASYLFSLLSSRLIYYPSPILVANSLFAKYDHLHCNQALFPLASTVLRPYYVINMTCKSDICTDLLLPMTSPHPNVTALNST